MPAPSGLDRNELYDRQTIEIINRVLKPASTGLDVGAHHGTFLRYMVAAAPEGIHFAFEPLPDVARDLRLQFPNVRVFECALSDVRGISSFHHVVNDRGYSGLRRREYDRPDAQVEEITVSTERLDDLIPPEVHVDFAKIDVEGGEYHVMLGGLATIRRCRPVVVFEASPRSTTYYGVGPNQLYYLVTEQCGMTLSTMDRWLNHQPPYTAEDFQTTWSEGSEYYFIAAP